MMHLFQSKVSPSVIVQFILHLFSLTSMGISPGQWRMTVGSCGARCKQQLPGTGIDSNVTSAAFFSLVLPALLVVGGVELNPGPNSQSCPGCDSYNDQIERRTRAVERREADGREALALLQQREAACDTRENLVELREQMLNEQEAIIEEAEATVAKAEKDYMEAEIVRSLLEDDLIPGDKREELLEWAVQSKNTALLRYLSQQLGNDN